jgi:hypothetical protein
MIPPWVLRKACPFFSRFNIILELSKDFRFSAVGMKQTSRYPFDALLFA